MRGDKMVEFRAATIAACVAGVSVAAWSRITAAEGPLGPTDVALDHEDHHQRPAPYDDPDYTLPPASHAEPDYPLAASFTPADSSNYTAGGITSYQYVVVHTMQGYYAGSIGWFQNPDANVSAHYCMRSEDGEVTQMVRNADRAWHVGSENSWSLGIEHEGFVDDASWYTWETYTSSAKLARWLCDTYEIPIDRDHIVGHVELPNQTHTDPGPNWDWGLYMALIHDLVAQGTVEGFVVDASAPCTVTATTDTWLKRTLESSDALADDEKCLITAGTQLQYLHASGDMVGHRRLSMPGDGPCAGIGDLDVEGFALAEHFDGFCEDGDTAVPGVEVTLDGATTVMTDEVGRFVFDGVAPGMHDLDVAATDGWFAAAETIDVAVHPGARVVIAMQPELGDDPTTGGDGSGGSGDGGGVDDGLGDDSGGTTGAPGSETGALPPGFGEDDAAGCGCRSGDPTAPVGLLGLAGLLLARRRRA